MPSAETDRSGNAALKIFWVHNFATHYTRRLFELIGQRLPVKFLFYSQGRERYWLKEHGTQTGSCSHEYLPGFSLLGTRIVPALAFRLLVADYSAVAKCINGKFALPVSYAIARLRRKPFILYTGIWMRVNTPAHRLGFPLVRHIYRNSDAIIAYGEHVKRYLIGEGVRPEHIFAEKHAVDNHLYNRPVAETQRENVFKSLGVPAGARLILYLGRLEIVKGLEYLIRSFAALSRPDAVLVLAGVGSEREHLEALAGQLGLTGRVKFPGYVDPDDTRAWYAAAWAFVLPSVTTARDKETWGLVVNEAFNQGLPVIATDAVGAAAGGLIENGVNGLIVPEKDSAALSEALRVLLSDESLRERMSEAARRKIVRWDQEDAAEIIERAIRFALKGRKVNPEAAPLTAGGNAREPL